jgi:hypothetical protein
MSRQLNEAHQSESVIPFASVTRGAPADHADQLDQAGQTILGLLHKAAGPAASHLMTLTLSNGSYRTPPTQGLAMTGNRRPTIRRAT